MIKFKPNISNTYKTQYKGCSIEVSANKSYILVRNETDYEFFAANGEEFELTSEQGVTKDWSLADFDLLLEAIRSLKTGMEGENEQR
jgi:hypothetical protein